MRLTCVRNKERYINSMLGPTWYLDSAFDMFINLRIKLMIDLRGIKRCCDIVKVYMSIGNL